MADVCPIDHCGQTIDEADSIAELRGKAVLVPTGWDPGLPRINISKTTHF